MTAHAPTPGGSAGSEPKMVREVLDDECALIAKRRHKAGLFDRGVEPEAMAETVRDSLVGLALSGGGIRSASFNLGMLQALHKKGLLRYMDYLSTVSGGGYVGSYYSSMVHALAEGNDPHAADFPLGTKVNGKPSKAVVRLLHRGQYLFAPLEFADRYLVGLLWVNLTLFSLVLSFCACVAFLFRLPDLPPIQSWLYWASGERANEAVRPFLPFALVACLWLAAWGLRTLAPRRRLFRWTNVLFGGVVFTFLAGWAVWLGDPQIDLPSWGPTLTEHQHVLWLLAVLVGLCLLPFLSPARLLRSGTKPEGHWQRYIFDASSAALLCGVPFFLVYFLGRHDISGVTRDDARPLAPGDVVWSAFWSEAEVGKAGGPLTLLRQEWDDLIDRARRIRKPLKGDWRTYRQDEVEQEEVMRELDGWLLHQPFSRKQVERWVERALHNAGQAEPGKFALSGPQLDKLRRWELHLQTLPAGESWDGRLTEDERAELLHLTLAGYYPGAVQPLWKVRRSVVIARDQRFRLGFAALWLGMFVLLSVILNLNRTSLHGFYRDKLAQTFRYREEDESAGAPAVEARPAPLPLAELRTAEKGAPYQLLNGALQVSLEAEPDVHEGTSFLFSRLYCGSMLTGYCPTERYDGGRMTLDEAMAISGAALTPVQTRNWLVRLIMTILNLRLGQWLPNPKLERERAAGRGPGARRRCPVVASILADYLFRRYQPKEQRFCFVTDGGHNDNLGMGELMRRWCALIVVSDAGEDGTHSVRDLIKLHRRVRLRGAELAPLTPRAQDVGEFDVLSLAPLDLDGGNGNCASHMIFARILYPDGVNGILVYLKPSLTGDEPPDLLRFREQCPDFPHSPTSHQVYDSVYTESYRQLGYHIGLSLCRVLGADALAEAWAPARVPDGWNREAQVDELARSILGRLSPGPGGAGGGAPGAGQPAGASRDGQGRKDQGPEGGDDRAGGPVRPRLARGEQRE